MWWHKTPIVLGRLLVLGAVVSWATYMLGWMRTMQFGQSWRLLWGSLALVCIFVLPVALLSLLGFGRRRFVMGLVAALALPLVLPEIPARAQEWVFKRRHSERPVSEGPVFERRWWPFRGSVLIYEPETDEWSGDC